MEPVLELGKKEFQAEANLINKNQKFLKEEKIAKVASAGGSDDTPGYGFVKSL